MSPLRSPLPVLVAIIATAMPQSASAAGPVVESVGASPTTRDCVLFVGTEFKVRDEAGWHRVIGVEKEAFLAEENGALVRIAMDRPGFEFTFERTPKIAVQEVEFVEYAAEPAYTPQRDPRRRWLENQNLALNSAEDEVNAATRRLRGAIAAEAQLQAMVGGQSANTPAAVIESMRSGPAPDSEAAMRGLEASVWHSQSEQFDPAFYDRRQHGEVAGFDALRIEGVLQAAEALENPHVVVLVEFILPDDEAPRHRVFGQSLPRVAAGGQHKVSFLKGGFPPGFTVKSVKLHFFENGREVPLPDADRRTPVSRADALQFIVLEHGARQRRVGEATPASVALEFVEPADRAAWATQGRACYVRVSPTGKAEGVFADEAGQRPLADPRAEALIARMGFRPAVTADGETVAAMLRLEPDDLQGAEATL